MLTVRPARPDDQPAIQMVDAAATATLRQTYRPNHKALCNRAKLDPCLRRLVATIADRVVGTVQYHVEPPFLKILGLGVHPHFRRSGVARELIRSLEEIGKHEGATGLRLHTVQETGNVDVFRRLGFAVVAEQEDDFCESDQYNTLIDVEMEKRLK